MMINMVLEIFYDNISEGQRNANASFAPYSFPLFYNIICRSSQSGPAKPAASKEQDQQMQVFQLVSNVHFAYLTCYGTKQARLLLLL